MRYSVNMLSMKELAMVDEQQMPDHVHMRLSIPPKHAISNVVGHIKGKNAIVRRVRRSDAEFDKRDVLGARVFRIDR